MERKVKYDLAFKLNCVKEVLEFYFLMSRPEITIQKKESLWKNQNNYVKRSQRDYTLSFKINAVKEIELGELSVTAACRNYGIQSRSTVVNYLRKFGKID